MCGEWSGVKWSAPGSCRRVDFELRWKRENGWELYSVLGKAISWVLISSKPCSRAGEGEGAVGPTSKMKHITHLALLGFGGRPD